jgi:chromosome segregation ATPase
MSELPQIDPLKVAQKDVAKLETELRASRNRESQLEVLAEALRDQRDDYERRLTELNTEAPVA